MVQFKWKQQTGKYQCGQDCFVGIVKVGSAEYAMRPQGTPIKYRAYVTLPGIRLKDDTIDHLTIDGAKERVERAVKTWFEWLEQE